MLDSEDSRLIEKMVDREKRELSPEMLEKVEAVADEILEAADPLVTKLTSCKINMDKEMFDAVLVSIMTALADSFSDNIDESIHYCNETRTTLIGLEKDLMEERGRNNGSL